MPDLSTSYLGLKLRNPLIASASPLTLELDNIRALEDAAPRAVVLPSVFEEQIEQESAELEAALAMGAESVAEASSFMPPIAWHSRLARDAGNHPPRPRRRRHSGHRQPERRHRERAGSPMPPNWSRPAPARSNSMSISCRPTRR